MKAMLLEATLKSGAKIQFRVSEFSSFGSGYTWTTPAGVLPRLVDLVAGEVAAVVRIK